MFKVLMGLKEGLASVEFDENATDTPKVTRIGPAQA